jgi:soluble lytic murein transglycosylase-like protein
MQLIPSTARRFGVANTFNPQQNIEGGVKYLKFLIELFNSDYVKVIAAYNAGEAAVAKYGGIPPYAETKNYVNQVGRNLVNARKAAEQQKTTVALAGQTAETVHSIQSVISADGRIYYKTQ